MNEQRVSEAFGQYSCPLGKGGGDKYSLRREVVKKVFLNVF